ncbi:hypothetical protein M422DRAFT_780269 [Sphaerobolus stellatus SS14]|uniref:Cytochrome P450 n=1 Tax=Sphaerobolus stellatus (strain SS14) TaxID=990650 RepID=A0A0C9VIX4_SPHS4|nr:hypothetical protein M422DRAFT_780269 [Sphaerobolus stellatus SS14]
MASQAKASIPATCSTDPISSFFAARRSISEARSVVEEGAKKYNVFRIPQMDRWHIVVSGQRYVDDLRKASDEYLSFNHALEETMLLRYLIGPTITTNEYTTDIVRQQLSRHLPNLFGALKEEIILAFEAKIPPTEEWTKYHAYGTMVNIIAQVTNRILVGAPLCRNTDFLNLNIMFTMEVAEGNDKLRHWPDILRPLVARWVTCVPKRIEEASEYVRPYIEEKQKKIDEYGKDYPDKEQTLLTWLLDEATGEERTLPRLTNRVLSLNFAAIHTSSMTFTQALYELAARPEYLAPLREEVESVVKHYGWTKMALVHMNKLDSFFKETQRMNGLGCLSMTRLAMKDFTFHDNTRIPKGAIVSASSITPHYDDKIYPDAQTFDGFRFAKLRQKEGQGTTNQFVATSNDYLPFGHGRHACPGRFFAANEIKAMMAHVILTYDIKLEQEGVKPLNEWRGPACVPNTRGSVLFRRRRD